jgi:hypothetical protein
MKMPKRSVLLNLCALLSLLVLASAPRAARGARHAATDCPSDGCRYFLPIVFRSPTPMLIAPSNGELTVSLAPKLSWIPVITGTYQVQVSVDPTFDPAVARLEIDDNGIVVSNLQPQEYTPIANVNSATTFYWRVGAPRPEGYVYSQVRQFTTPARNTKLLPLPVQLLSPPNNTMLTSSSVTLSWQAMSDVIGYRVRMAEANDPNDRAFGPGTATLPSTQTSHLATGLKSGVTYTWKVKALNQYGWGSYVLIYSLTAP